MDDIDEDLQLAIKLSEEIEFRYSRQNTPSKRNSTAEYSSEGASTFCTHDDNDLAKAIKRSKEIDTRHCQQNPNKQKHGNEQISKDRYLGEDEDLLLAIQLSEETEAHHSQKTTSTKQKSSAEQISKNTYVDEDEDLLLAIKLSEETEAKTSQYNTFTKQKNSAEQISKDTYEDEDLLLAIKLSEEIEVEHSLQNTPTTAHSTDMIVDLNKLTSVPTSTKFHSKLAVQRTDYSDRPDPVVSIESSKGNTASMDDNDIFLLENNDSDYLLAMQLSLDAEVEIFKDDKGDVDHLKAVMPFQNFSTTVSAKSKKKRSLTDHKYLDRNISVVDPSWETIDPNPDIYALFYAFNKRFFWGKLDMVEVKWSPRMTSCAGICTYRSRAGHCIVSLSKPLLMYRPRKDLVETLLHEMIHAYLFVTKNRTDRDGHGPQFHEHMYRINRESGARITVFHSFHDEVRIYKTHWWKCDGPCQQRPPYFGMVKRSMNRAPGPNDIWWNDHLATCGGTYHKVKEPENYGKKKSEKQKKAEIATSCKNTNIADFFSRPKASSSASSSSHPTTSSAKKTLLNFSGDKLAQFEDVPQKTNQPMPVPTSSVQSISGVIPPSSTKPVSTFVSNKIVTLGDLSRKINQKSPNKNSSKSPKKWIPLPGQRNILQFVNKL